jgi:hypothetical protein
MDPFDFVSGEDFRAALISDYGELQAAVSVGAWKAVHVLAGSIVEAVLIDHIAGSNIPADKGIDPLTLDLGAAIKLCREEDILSERTATLSDVVRSYRNLIHPGRVIRLAEEVDENSAGVAVSLVEMIAKEVGRARAKSRGYTAEQLVAKMDQDPSAVPIARHLLSEMSTAEQSRLLSIVLPSRCLSPIRTGDAADIPVPMGALFRAAYNLAPKELQKTATEAFVKVLREEPENVVIAYETAFFRAGDLTHLAKPKQAMVKAHLLARLKASRTVELLECAKGISPFLTSAELRQLVDAIVSEIVYGRSSELDTAARDLLSNVYQFQTSDADAVMIARLQNWIDLLHEKGNASESVVAALKAEFDAEVEIDELPF